MRPAPALLPLVGYCLVVESLDEEPDFDFELLLSLLLLLGEVALPEDDGDASEDEPADDPGVVDDGVDCAPEVLSVLDCVPYGDL